MAIERLRYSDVSYRRTRWGRLVNRAVDDGWDCTCPRCNMVLYGGVDHAQTRQCDGCHLWLRVHGNLLEVTDRGADFAPPAPPVGALGPAEPDVITLLLAACHAALREQLSSETRALVAAAMTRLGAMP